MTGDLNEPREYPKRCQTCFHLEAYCRCNQPIGQVKVTKGRVSFFTTPNRILWARFN